MTKRKSVRLDRTPLSTFTPSSGNADSVTVYPNAIMYSFDAERSEMWASDLYRREIWEDVWRAVGAYKRPILLLYWDGGVAGRSPNVSFVDHEGNER